jgi:hypothetical protein
VFRATQATLLLVVACGRVGYDASSRAVQRGGADATAGDPGNGAIGYWRLDETSGALALDASSGRNHGVLKGGAAWGPGRFGSGPDVSITIGSIDGGTGGISALAIRYTSGDSNLAPFKSLYVNGVKVGQAVFPNTGGWAGSARRWTGSP